MFSHALSIKARRIRWGVLALSLTPIIGVLLRRFGFRPLPVSCLFQWLLGVPSPGCGMTRSLIALTKGDWQQAFMYHLFGPVLFLVCVFAVVQTLIELVAGRSLSNINGRPLSDDYRRILGKPHWLGTVLVLFLLYYAIRLYARYASMELPFGLTHLSVWQWVVAGAKAL